MRYLYEKELSEFTVTLHAQNLLCSYNDKFLFFTNCLPIDNLERIPFNITTDFERGTHENLPHLAQPPYPENLKFFERFTTAQAVNNDTKTCWKIHRSIRPGDLFGIDFQIIQTNRALSFSIEYLHQKSLQTKLQISISLDSQTWVQFSQQNQSGAIYDKENLVIFHTGLFPVGFQIFRFIKFVSLEDTETSFHICDVRLLHNKTFE
ncbi:unnamed protein product [Rotaria magnacalcarata]